VNTAQPPRLASWLLRRLAGGSKRESLIGDLDEQVARGRSSSWYWRQVLSAILVGAATDLRDHKLLAVRAVLVGWAVLIPWFYLTIAVSRRIPFREVTDTWIPGVWSDADSVLLRMAWWAWWIYEVPLVIAWCGVSLVIGWMIARLHREHQAALLFACVASQLPWTVLWAWPVWRNAQISLVDSSYAFPNQVLAVLILVGMPICTLLGGLWSVESQRNH
jgi:hypothetical protein